MGPLHGYRVVEFAGLGPAPFCAMMLADMGAEVIRLDRVEPADLGMERDPCFAFVNRGRRSIALDLKQPEAQAAALRLTNQADALIEGFRPGVMERLGLGPEVCCEANPRLIYGRMTGWGQTGPMAHDVGHDLNYLAITGGLHSIGRKGQPPTPPLNLVADLAGGSLYLAFGIVCAMLEAKTSGLGQVIDAAIIDGVAALLTGVFGARAAGQWSDVRGDNYLDSGAPWYDSYETSDGRYIAIAAIEARFYRVLLERLGLAELPLPAQHDKARWPELRQAISGVVRQKSQAEWIAIMAGHDACFAPVLDLAQAPGHPQMHARGAFISVDDMLQPAPAPQFSRSIPDHPAPPSRPGRDTAATLADWGFSTTEIDVLRDAQAVR